MTYAEAEELLRTVSAAEIAEHIKEIRDSLRPTWDADRSDYGRALALFAKCLETGGADSVDYQNKMNDAEKKLAQVLVNQAVENAINALLWKKVD